MTRITIDPITRLEGHGKIEIFLNEEGDVENTYLQIPELRGFEQFCVGRPAEEMPRITNRICGVCIGAYSMWAGGRWKSVVPKKSIGRISPTSIDLYIYAFPFALIYLIRTNFDL